MGPLGLVRWGDRYGAALAQPTRRKLALLVGINAYPNHVCDLEADCFLGQGSALGTPLQGCLTDVELQRELLLNRFGFSDRDILTLVDGAATRDSIETAFQTHLVEQARPGDVVVFHFSGLGSQVRGGDRGTSQRSLVPVDGQLPTQEQPIINDLLHETLALLLQAVKTDQLVTVLDTSYTTPDSVLQGALRGRSRPNAPMGQYSPDELQRQAALLEQLKLSPDALISQAATLQFPGVVLWTDGQALEGQWNGFSAGLLTYGLTQHLWSMTPATTLRMVLSRTATAVEQVAGDRQRLRLTGRRSQDQKLLPYYGEPPLRQGADGVVTSVAADGKSAQVFVTGLAANVLEHYSPSSVFTVDVPVGAPPAEGATVGQEITSLESGLPSGPEGSDRFRLQVRSRDGLKVSTRVCCGNAAPPLLPGQLVYESIRILPRQIGLTVAIDPALERIERVDATSAFATLPGVSSVVAGGQAADCLFGKTKPAASTVATSLVGMEEEPRGRLGATVETPSRIDVSTAVSDAPVMNNRYGLFLLGRSLVPQTLIGEDEAVKTAVNRLAPTLQTLLGLKLIRLTENAGTSRLGVRATLELVAPQERIVAQQETVRSPLMPSEGRLASLVPSEDLPELPLGGRLRYRLTNYGDRPVYVMMFGLSSSGDPISLYSADSAGAIASLTLFPGEPLTLPNGTTGEWFAGSSLGTAETHLLFSHAPFTKTRALLTTTASASTSPIIRLSHPLEVAKAILSDLHHGTQDESDRPSDSPPDSYTLNVNHWATLSFLHRVTPA